MRQELTIRQQRFVKLYVENGGNASRAALGAGYRHRQRGYELVSKSVILIQINIFLNGTPFNREEVYKRISQGMNATKLQAIPYNALVSRKNANVS